MVFQLYGGNMIWEIYAYGCRAELDGFEGVFDLEETTFWREGAGQRSLDGHSIREDSIDILDTAIWASCKLAKLFLVAGTLTIF